MAGVVCPKSEASIPNTIGTLVKLGEILGAEVSFRSDAVVQASRAWRSLVDAWLVGHLIDECPIGG